MIRKGKYKVMHTTRTSRSKGKKKKRQVINDCYAADLTPGLFSSIAFVPWPLVRLLQQALFDANEQWRMQGTLSSLVLFFLSASYQFIIYTFLPVFFLSLRTLEIGGGG